MLLDLLAQSLADSNNQSLALTAFTSAWFLLIFCCSERKATLFPRLHQHAPPFSQHMNITLSFIMNESFSSLVRERSNVDDICHLSPIISPNKLMLECVQLNLTDWTDWAIFGSLSDIAHANQELIIIGSRVKGTMILPANLTDWPIFCFFSPNARSKPISSTNILS